jgi:hypothetical protein
MPFSTERSRKRRPDQTRRASHQNSHRRILPANRLRRSLATTLRRAAANVKKTKRTLQLPKKKNFSARPSCASEKLKPQKITPRKSGPQEINIQNPEAPASGTACTTRKA